MAKKWRPNIHASVEYVDQICCDMGVVLGISQKTQAVGDFDAKMQKVSDAMMRKVIDRILIMEELEKAETSFEKWEIVMKQLF